MTDPQDFRAPYHHGDLRAALLAAAEALLASGATLSLRSVAKAAGVSHAAPYHHFANLEALLAAVAARGFDDLAAAMRGAQQGGDTAATLVGHCTAYVAFALARPAVFRLMFSPLLQRKAEHPALQAAADGSFQVLLQAARAHVPEGGDALALAGWSLAHGLASLAIDGALSTAPVAVPSAHELAAVLAARLLKGGFSPA
ncbi:transcriptional regulator [Acidovorax sp. CF316]|uniref:TetR-like C-terminal domain-containing protein n=1 Tax=Acidovorax sp. CF316 TaxID=1144317 RepID=UPI00026BCADC|nr:TetR-like C-terminal domain-containing protein [Acidovorax sp. CF316]EJE53732.1 transcriptional regulator [Acidovorax sp. CF316]